MTSKYSKPSAAKNLFYSIPYSIPGGAALKHVTFFVNEPSFFALTLLMSNSPLWELCLGLSVHDLPSVR
jgi:hypothetical protein